MNMTILALDLGTTTGWALIGADGQITSGSQSFKPQRFEGGGMRFLKFKRWLTDVKQCTTGVDLVVFEEVRRHVGVDAVKRSGWREQHILVFSDQDERLDFLEREFIRRIGERLYGSGGKHG